MFSSLLLTSLVGAIMAFFGGLAYAWRKPPPRNEDLERTIAERDAALEDCQRLRVENTTLRQRLDASVAELDRVRSEAAAAKPAPVAPTPEVVPPPPAPTVEADDTLESILAARLSELLKRGDGNAAVLADAQGLLLAGVGDEHDQQTMAALASLAVDLCERAQDYLGLGRVIRLELADVDGHALRVRLFPWDGEAFALATLCPPQLQPEESEESVVTLFPSLMEAAS